VLVLESEEARPRLEDESSAWVELEVELVELDL